LTPKERKELGQYLRGSSKVEYERFKYIYMKRETAVSSQEFRCQLPPKLVVWAPAMSLHPLFLRVLTWHVEAMLVPRSRDDMRMEPGNTWNRGNSTLTQHNNRERILRKGGGGGDQQGIGAQKDS
jgi:hypothetical protein